MVAMSVCDDGAVNGAPRVYVKAARLAKQAVRCYLKQRFSGKRHYFSMIECWNQIAEGDHDEG